MRDSILIKPYERLEEEKIKEIHNSSLSILRDPGIISYSREAAEIFRENGAGVSFSGNHWKISIPEKLVEESLRSAPSVIRLGARERENGLILNGKEPRIRFGTGSEANIILDTSVEDFVSEETGIKKRIPVFKRRRGSIKDLCQAARLCEHLQNVDFFIRTVNIQDEDITEDNKDINKFYASLSNVRKHTMSGLTNPEKLDDVIRMAEIISDGNKDPIISFITCVIKSPLQLVEDATQNLIEIAKRGYPVSISTSPQGGSTAPLQEGGMLIQLNAEILAGITLAQLVRKGTPVLYGSVPLRVRMDNLDNMYGAPETNLYNMGGAQMARFYGIPCYSTAGVGDSKFPGIESLVNKLLSYLFMAASGAQYIHYSFGLLEGTNTFSLEQAILDDLHIGMVKSLLKGQNIEEEIDEGLKEIREVMNTPHKMFTRYTRKYLRGGELLPFYPYGGDANEALIEVSKRKEELLSTPVEGLSEDIKREIFQEFDILERIR